MKMKGRLLPALGLVVGIVLALGFSACIEDDDDDDDFKKPLTFEKVAQYVDFQLGQISDGTDSNAVCGGNAGAIGVGGHCKNQLFGITGAGQVTAAVRLAQDNILFENDLLTAGENFIFTSRGFSPQTSDPCTEDGNTDNIADYSQVCTAGTGTLECTYLSDTIVRLSYDNCQWLDGGTTYVIDGAVDLSYYTTGLNELVAVGTTGRYEVLRAADNASFSLNGIALRYLKINPVTGEPALGTTNTNLDGMVINNLNVSVDMNGDGTWDAPAYNLYFAVDFEDGLFFFTDKYSGVWLEDIGVFPTGLTFYDGARPWNLLGLGCQVDVTMNADRTYNLSSTGTYGGNGCIADQQNIPY